MILLATVGIIKATWVEKSPVVWSVGCLVLGLGMAGETWLAQVWRWRALSWQAAYYQDTEQLQKQIQELRPQSRRGESRHLSVEQFCLEQSSRRVVDWPLSHVVVSRHQVALARDVEFRTPQPVSLRGGGIALQSFEAGNLSSSCSRYLAESGDYCNPSGDSLDQE